MTIKEERALPIFWTKSILGLSRFCNASSKWSKETRINWVEITEPIVWPIGYQSSAEQNEAKRTGSLGAEIREPIVWPFSYQDSSGQNEGMGYTKKPLLIGVEIKEPVVRPVNFEEALVISQGKEWKILPACIWKFHRGNEAPNQFWNSFFRTEM